MKLTSERVGAVARGYRLNHGLRRLRTRNDSEYLFRDPASAAHLNRAIEDAIAGRTIEVTMDELYARYGLGRET